jgi:diguanylate cyclase (GGDEF)-like protein
MSVIEARQPDAGQATLRPEGRRRLLRASEVGLVVGLAAFGAYLLLTDPSEPRSDFFDRYLYCSLILGSGLLCLARAVLVPRERLAWTFIALDLLAWGGGETVWAAVYADDPNAPYPNLSDVLYLLSYPFAYLGIALLVRDRVSRFRPATWLDGAVAGLTLSAFASAFLLPKVIESGEGPFLADAVTIGYPVADTLLLSFLLGVLVIVGLRADRTWLLIVASLAILPLADGIYSYQEALGTYQEGSWLDFLWPLSAVLLGLTAWIPSYRQPAQPTRGIRSLATPAVFAVAAAALVSYGYVAGINTVSVLLAGAALIAAALRLAVTYRENQRLFETSQTDGLTGLANRSALMLDLADALDRQGMTPDRVLAMFDLNGFKIYNDSFGHPAGDALLNRVAARFAQEIQPNGRAYRIGGDEFCALLHSPPEQAASVVSRAAAALGDSGEGFAVTAAAGMVRLPEEAQNAHQALQLADRRMYEDKAISRSSARSQAHEVLSQALRERQPELGRHVDLVADLAAAVGRRLGLSGEQLDLVIRAARLHDIGKVAIPDAVLDKRSALEEEEWGFIYDHTVVGERILREAPALVPVAELVRASHERWDGLGYPDGLRREEIPLGARIIFACDAFHAMTSGRPYATAVSVAEATSELRRCAGGQFDPAVVEALCAELQAGGPVPPELRQLDRRTAN